MELNEFKKMAAKSASETLETASELADDIKKAANNVDIDEFKGRASDLANIARDAVEKTAHNVDLDEIKNRGRKLAGEATDTVISTSKEFASNHKNQQIAISFLKWVLLLPFKILKVIFWLLKTTCPSCKSAKCAKISSQKNWVNLQTGHRSNGNSYWSGTKVLTKVYKCKECSTVFEKETTDNIEGGGSGPGPNS
jgi:hypothetical protein